MDSGRVNAAGDIIATLSARVSDLTKRVAMLQAELESATKRLAVYEEHDATVQDALATALKSAYQIRERAETAADQILEQAREERRMLLSEIARLRDERDQLQEEIAAQRRSAISAVSPRPLTSDDAAAELRAVASEALKGLFQEIVDEMRTTARPARAEPRREEPREEIREEPRRPERRAEPRREAPRREAPRRAEPHLADAQRMQPPPMAEAPTYEAMKRVRRARVTEDEDLPTRAVPEGKAPVESEQRADFVETSQAVEALLSLDTRAPAAEPPASVEETVPVYEPPVAEPEVAEAEVAEEAVAEAPAVEEAPPAEPTRAQEPMTVEPIEEVEIFEAPVMAPAPEPAPEPGPVAQEPEPVAQEAEPIAPEPVAEAAPTPAAPEQPPAITQRPIIDWRIEALSGPPPQPEPQRTAPSLPTSFASDVAEAQPEPEPATSEPATSFEAEEAVEDIDPRLHALGAAQEMPPAPLPRPPLEVVRAPVEMRETHPPRVEAAAPTSDIQLVLSPVPSFPRLVEIERRIQSLPVVRTLYVRDFRAGAATLAVALRAAMTPEEFASILAGLQQPRLRLVAGSRNILELRIEGEAGVA